MDEHPENEPTRFDDAQFERMIRSYLRIASEATKDQEKLGAIERGLEAQPAALFVQPRWYRWHISEVVYVVNALAVAAIAVRLWWP